jgi:hypothetical protein
LLSPHKIRLSRKIQVIPSGYSVLRSTYDYKNDIMFIYTRNDFNKNGTLEKEEPIVIYWIKLSNPTVAKKMI